MGRTGSEDPRRRGRLQATEEGIPSSSLTSNQRNVGFSLGAHDPRGSTACVGSRQAEREREREIDAEPTSERARVALSIGAGGGLLGRPLPGRLPGGAHAAGPAVDGLLEPELAHHRGPEARTAWHIGAARRVCESYSLRQYIY